MRRFVFYLKIKISKIYTPLKGISISKTKLQIKELTEKKNLFDLIYTENARRSELEKGLIERQNSLKELQAKHDQDIEAIKRANSLHSLHASFRKEAEELSVIQGQCCPKYRDSWRINYKKSHFFSNDQRYSKTRPLLQAGVTDSAVQNKLDEEGQNGSRNSLKK